MSTSQDGDTDLCFSDPDDAAQIPTRSNRVADAVRAAGHGHEPSRKRSSTISRLLNAAQRYTSSKASKFAQELFGSRRENPTPSPLLIPSEIPIDKYFPAEIHLEIFSYLPWEAQLACSLASHIWAKILLAHGKDYSLNTGGIYKNTNGRYSNSHKRVAIMHHVVFWRRTCELEIHEDGTERFGLASKSFWTPFLSLEKRKGRNSYRRYHLYNHHNMTPPYIYGGLWSPPSYSSFSISSSSFSSLSSVSSLHSTFPRYYGDDEDGDDVERREVVYIPHPDQNFIMNDVLLKPNPDYISRSTLFAKLFSRKPAVGSPPPQDIHPKCTIILRIANKAGDKDRKSITRHVFMDSEREEITVKVFLEYVARVVRENREFGEGDVRKVEVSKVKVKDRKIIFAVFVGEAYSNNSRDDSELLSW
ncbi:hypothetical protein TWF481_009859 [Arthrobotrys musiformis]|uniref:F-box domain-containing protein n=1 Tax=Arthrobotrys musiformis TaxID=47236 RepID=A0AAV9W655_9PEZI